jgi:toxin-antitoxin system PIN domain toxin
MLLDANLLLYAEDETSPFHQRARSWLTDVLNGDVRVGLPWPTLLAFVRIRTHPRVYDRPLTGDQAWTVVEDWLAAPASWVPTPTVRHSEVLGALIRRYHLSAAAIPDAHLAALAIEYGVALCSADAGFARFSELRWTNPVQPDRV